MLRSLASWRRGSNAPPKEMVIYYVDGHLVFDVEEIRIGEGGEMCSHYEEVLTCEVGDGDLWHGPVAHFEG